MKLRERVRAARAAWRAQDKVIQAEPMDINSPSFLELIGLKKKASPREEITYFTCLKHLSETVAKMPIKLFCATDEGPEELKDDKLAYLLRTRPNPIMTPTIFWNTVEMNRNHWGNAYVYIRRKFERQKFGGELKVLDLWIMPSENTRIMIDDKGIFAGAGRMWYIYTDAFSGQQYVFPSEDVMHFKTSHTLNGIAGESVQSILAATVSGASASQEYLNSLYQQGMTAKAVLEYTGDLSTEAREKLRGVFEEFGAGAKNTGRVLPVPMGFKLTPIDFKLADSQFFELKKYTALQLGAAFGVKPNQLNDYEKSSYANSEQQNLSFYVDTALFIIKQYEEEINYKLLGAERIERGEYAKFNEKVLMRTDSKTQMEVLAQGVTSTLYAPNEGRRKLDMKDKPGGDKLIANGGSIWLEQMGTQYTGGTPPPSTDPGDSLAALINIILAQHFNQGGEKNGKESETV